MQPIESSPLIHAAARNDTVTGDLRCVECGYNLRTLPEAGRCPECGTEVARSLLGDFLCYAKPWRAASLGLGIGFVFAGCLNAPLPFTHSLAMAFGVPDFLLYTPLIFTTLAFVGICLFTSGYRSGQLPIGSNALRWSLRTTAFILIASRALVIVSILTRDEHLFWLGWGLWWILIIECFLLARYIRVMAPRLRARHLAIHANIAMIGMPLLWCADLAGQCFDSSWLGWGKQPWAGSLWFTSGSLAMFWLLGLAHHASFALQRTVRQAREFAKHGLRKSA